MNRRTYAHFHICSRKVFIEYITQKKIICHRPKSGIFGQLKVLKAIQNARYVGNLRVLLESYQEEMIYNYATSN